MKNTIHLQSIGQTSAKPAREFKVGDTMVWNFGMTNEVVGIVKETRCFLTFELQAEDGKVYTRRLKKDRLVGTAS